jgi:hypothetical protein
MMKGICRFFFFVFLSCASNLPAQFENFSDVWPVFLSPQTAFFGNGLSVYDFDQDGMDDLTIAELNQGVGLYRNNLNGFELVYYVGFIGDVKQIVWVDYDNDHDADLFFTANGQGIHLWRNEGDYNFTDMSWFFDDYSASFAYGAAWADYDRDGLLDVYVCMYDYPGTSVFPNLLFHQNENHSFDEVGSELGVGSSTDEAFQPAWIDFDQDGWLDLYVINDHSVPNEFYHNNQGENFTEIAALNGSNVAQSSMSNSISDFDNDGDFDVFITDGGAPVLLRNDGGLFIDVASEAGLGQWANNWSALWLDYDLDGFEDLHVCTENPGTQPDHNFFYANQQNGFFYDSGLDNTNRDSFCAAKGDFNNDGRWDYAVLNGYPPSIDVWINISEPQGVKLSLQGTLGNRDGVGAFIEYWVNGNRRITQSQCGENYISQNSQYEILATEGVGWIDSLNVIWPGGWIDRYQNLASGAFYTLTEGESISDLNSVALVNVCPGDSTLLAVPSVLDFIWENGDTSSQRWVTGAGEFTATITNNFGLQYTNRFNVALWDIPEVNALLTSPLCFESTDGHISLLLDESSFVSMMWSDGFTDAVRNNLSAGNYGCELTTLDGCIVQEVFVLTHPESIAVLGELDKNICHGAVTSVEPEISGGVEPYEINWLGEDPNALGEGPHAFEVIDANGCLASFDLVVGWLPAIEVEVFADTVCHGATTSLQYVASGGSGELVFDFDEIDPESVGQGNYQVLVTDEQTCFVIHSFEVAAWETMQNNAVITHAQNGANGSIEINTSGGTAPYQYAWSNGSTDAAMDNLTQDEYSCVITDANGCTDEITIELVDLLVGTVFSSIEIFPQPFFESLTIAMPGEHNIRILNAAGQLIEQQRINGRMVLDTSAWSSGSYFLEIDQMQRKLLIRE